ncbi:hypothetical protein T459_04822 [Capsicum annuum]|uniref:Ubiquitin-like domain-containing protein n=1 Tax=Capsicum annuum TaxID=4072 RepID=A0A2G3A643_CAPAN|nr:hypothetical protein T459_04822 [Capsicum annuum]
MLIALAAVYGLEIHQMNVKTAFLNGELKEEIYMKKPKGFVVPGKENKVCKIIKSLYGLKQAPKQWHAKFDKTMLANGFKINECDKCVYIKDTLNHQVIVCLYVDDMLIISRDISDINTMKQMLESKFGMKDLGVVDVILGIRIHRTPQGLTLSQYHYIENVLGKFKYMKFGIAKTSLDVSFALRKNEAGEEAEWLWNFLEDIPYCPKPVTPVCIHCDSQTAIGELKMMLSMVTGLEPEEQRLLYRVKEREDYEHLHMVGVRDKDKVLLYQDPSIKETKLLSHRSLFLSHH